MSEATHVVCLGGGWVAIYLARALRPAITKGSVKLTVVSRDNYSTVHGLIAEMLTCKIQPQQIIASVREVIAPAHLHNAEIESIDFRQRHVLTRRSLDGRAYTLPYDHLVVAVGSVEDFSRYAGIAEHAFPLKTFADCYRLRNHLLSVLEMASIETNAEERQRLLTFVIAGGNYAGVEVACDLIQYLRLLARTKYPELNLAEFRIVLLEAGPRILPELEARHPYLVRYAEKRVLTLGLSVRLNHSLQAATAEEAVLNTGEHIPTRTIITCTGMTSSPLLDQLPYERDRRGRIATDHFCRVLNNANIWAGGDCAAVPHPDGGTCPTLAHYAQKAGSNIGANILRTISGKPLKPYSFNGLGEACTLGHRCAIAHLKGIPACGFLAWIGWRFIVLTMFIPSWTRRVRLVLDWFLTLVLGRDVVNPRIDDRRAISHALYEPGQIIVSGGESRRYHYLVEAGEVEVVSGEEQLQVSCLKVGDYFGHGARPTSDCCIRARTRVRLLAIDGYAADAFKRGATRYRNAFKTGCNRSRIPLIMLSDPLRATLFELLLKRRSRRVGLGMTIPAGPFKYKSPHPPIALTEDEEAALAFAACGFTGYVLADLSYGAGQGGSMLAGRLGRTVASPDAVHTVAVLVTNDRGTWLLKRPQDLAPAEFSELSRLAQQGALTELYRRSRVQLSTARTAPPLDPGHNFSINQWSLYAPGTTYFLPIIETTSLTLNVLLELFGEGMGVFVRDERARFRPAGIARFARSRRGHLHDNPHELRSPTIQMVETALLESMATEHGMVLQNLALMTEALGLGGFPNFARHENSWFQAIGFRMQCLPASRYLGAPSLLSLAARWFRKDPLLEYPVGLERDKLVLLRPFCPPYYGSMADAVRAYVETKFGAQGSYGARLSQSRWREADSGSFVTSAPTSSAVEATIAYCDYVFQRYHRFPAYTAPFRTVIGFQVGRVDIDFYDQFYDPAALPETVRASTRRALEEA